MEFPLEMDRRGFIKTAAATAGAATLTSLLSSCESLFSPSVPSYLKGYEGLYGKDPRSAALKWFRDARFGLFLHYGLYSLLGRAEWVQYHEKIPVSEYEKLKYKFTARKFDADFIADLALAAEMKYVNITTRHHDGFCLFDTKTTDFNSVESAAKRERERTGPAAISAGLLTPWMGPPTMCMGSLTTVFRLPWCAGIGWR